MAASETLVSNNYPYLPLRVEIEGKVEEDLALIDTGFSGTLMVPDFWLERNLGMPLAFGTWELGNATKVEAPVYLGILEVPGLAKRIATMSVMGNEYILGRNFIKSFEVTLDRGKRVVVRP